MNMEDKKSNVNMIKAYVFVKHIEKHLEKMNLSKVCCKICNKPIDEIYDDYKRNKK